MTRTTLEFQPDLKADVAILDGKPATGTALERISHHLDHVRKLAGVSTFASVKSANNFPSGAGIASSASGFAALSVAAAAALGLELSERDLSILARLGSGSASRSVPSGFVEWFPGATHTDSYAESFAPVDYWDLVDLVAVVSHQHKHTGSTEGHKLAGTSILQAARVAHVSERLAKCKSAILDRDFAAFADVVEMDSNLMHAVMMTSIPALFYWTSETVGLMEAVRTWRSEGLKVCYTIDAGPNVHCLCLSGDASEIHKRLDDIPGVTEVRRAGPGRGAYIESIE